MVLTGWILFDGSIVGSATMTRLAGRRAHVGQIGMGVADGWTGRRIGTALLGALVDMAGNWLGLRRLELEVLADESLSSDRSVQRVAGLYLS